MSRTRVAAESVPTADERDHLLASIRDLDAEHAAGELGDDDYAALRADYVARAAAALRASAVAADATSRLPGRPAAGTGHGPDGRRFRRFLGRRSVRRWLGIGMAFSFAAIATVLALAVAGVRLPGEGVSGGVTLNQAQQVRQELEQAQVLGADGHVSDAIDLYDKVLAVEPNQPEALAYRGYLLCLTAQATKSPLLFPIGLASINEAITSDPGYGDAHFFDALVLLEDYGNKKGALQAFEQAFRDNVSSDLVQAERPTIERLFAAMHEPFPASLTQT